MSANNYLLIEHVSDTYYVNDVDADGGVGFRIDDEGYKTYGEALQAARDYMQDHIVEYGLRSN